MSRCFTIARRWSGRRQPWNRPSHSEWKKIPDQRIGFSTKLPTFVKSRVNLFFENLVQGKSEAFWALRKLLPAVCYSGSKSVPNYVAMGATKEGFDEPGASRFTSTIELGMSCHRVGRLQPLRAQGLSNEQAYPWDTGEWWWALSNEHACPDFVRGSVVKAWAGHALSSGLAGRTTIV